MRFAMLRYSILVSILLSSTVLAQQTRGIVIDRRPPAPIPASLEQQVRDADIVVLIRIIGSHDRSTGKMAGTGFRAQVLEVIKNADLPLGSEIVIHRFGGTVDGQYMEERGFPLWRPDTVLVAFLTWVDVRKAFMLTYGPDSSIEQDAAGKATTFGPGSSAKERGKPFSEVVGRIKYVAKGLRK